MQRPTVRHYVGIMGYLHQIPPPLRAQGTWRKRSQKEHTSQRGWKTLGEQGPLNQQSKAHRSSQRLKQQTWDLHESALGPLYLDYSCQLSIFMEFLTVRMSGTLTRGPALLTLFLLLGCHVQPLIWYNLPQQGKPSRHWGPSRDHLRGQHGSGILKDNLNLHQPRQPNESHLLLLSIHI